MHESMFNFSRNRDLIVSYLLNTNTIPRLIALKANFAPSWKAWRGILASGCHRLTTSRRINATGKKQLNCGFQTRVPRTQSFQWPGFDSTLRSLILNLLSFQQIKQAPIRFCSVSSHVKHVIESKFVKHDFCYLCNGHRQCLNLLNGEFICADFPVQRRSSTFAKRELHLAD